MSGFSVYMLALAGIEILVGLTMLGTLLAVIGFFIGGSKETTATETQIEESSDDDTDVKVLKPEITPTAKKSDKEAKGTSEKTENEGGKPVMAILQKPDSGDKPAYPKMPNVGEGPDLPSLPGESKPAEGEELERQIVEKQLQRIADKRAEHKKDEPDELPAFPIPPKVGGEKPASPTTPKPFLHELPQPAGKKKSASPATPKPFLHELPQPADSANVQDVAGSQGHEEERDS